MGVGLVRRVERGPRRAVTRALASAVVGALVMQCALTVAGLGNTVMTGRGQDDSGVKLFTAALCAAVAIPVVLTLRRRIDGRDLRSMGLTRAGDAARGFAGGLVVTTAAGGGLLWAATAYGALVWERVDPVQLVYFLVTNAVIALLLEALPEEIVYRGYVLTTVAETGRRVVAAVVTTVLFAMMPGFGTVLNRGARTLLGLPTEPLGFAPPGQHPVDYLILMLVFGSALALVRLSTGSVWPGVGMHLGFLTVNRIVLEGGLRGAGVSARLLEPAVILLIPTYVLVAALVVASKHVRSRFRHRRT